MYQFYEIYLLYDKSSCKKAHYPRKAEKCFLFEVEDLSFSRSYIGPFVSCLYL